MTTLTIQDLARTETMDRKALAAVRGGMMQGYRAPFLPGSYDFSTHNGSLRADQLIGQNQEVFNSNGNNVALAYGVESVVKPRQEAGNAIVRL